MKTPLAWRLALRTLPDGFRTRHREEMERALEVHLQGRSAPVRALVWARAVADTLMTAARLHREAGTLGTTRGRTLMGWVDDLRFAARALQRRPGFTAVAILTLAVGIGANTAMFSVVNGVLLRPLPYRAADRIGILWHEFGDGAQNLPAVHALDVRDYRDRSELFETFTMATGREWILGRQDDPEVVSVGLVEAGFFDFFGVDAALGRTFRNADDAPGMAPLVVLSHRVWSGRYGADPAVVGSRIPLAGTEMEVLGVLPEDFRLLLPGEAFLLRDADVWVSLRLDPARQPPRNYTGYTGFGRLREGVTFDQAQQEIDALSARLREEHREHAASGLVARVVPLHEDVVKGADHTLILLFGAVGFVLLIACANVANLVLVRGQTRSGELALRSALGAGRRSLFRLVMAESTLLSMAGVGLGVAMAWGLLGALTTLGSASVPRLEAVVLDGTVLGFAAGAGALSAGLFGLLPAWTAGRRDPAAALRAGGRGGESRRRRRFRDGLIVAEVAASLVLLVGTGLMVRSFAALGRVDPGFDPDGALTFRTSLPTSLGDNAARAALHQELIEAMEGLPGVERAALVSQLPLTGSGPLQPYAYDEETAANWESVTADQRYVTPGFFEALGARLIEGRTFTGAPEADRGTVVIDDRLAARAFPDGDVLGSRLQVNPNDAPESIRYVTVIGVVEHVRLHDVSRPHLTQIYYPQDGGSRVSFVIRSSGDPGSLVADVRGIMARLAPGAPVQDVRTLRDLVHTSLAPVRLALALMTAFGIVALLLAAVGLYGVLAYAVSRRTREIGVRMALGQAPDEVRRAVLGQGGRLVVVALAFGLPVAALLSRAAEGLLYGVAPLDPATYVATTLLLAAVAMAACWIPARRATGVDPATALRE